MEESIRKGGDQMSDAKSCVILDEKGLRFAKGTLVRFSEHDTIVELDAGYHEVAYFHIDHVVCVRTHDPADGLTNCRGRIYRLDENKLFITGCVIETHVEQREDIKIPVGRDVFFIACGKSAKDTKKFTVLLRDISAGGIGIATEHHLDFDSEYEVIFDFGWEPDVLPVTMVYKGSEVDGKVLYGFRFNELHPAQESQVREYVFRKHLSLFAVKQP